MSSELLLRASGITKVYSGTQHPLATLRQALFGTQPPAADEYPVLKDIDLDIYRGETVGIMGRNGAGKTTLLGILGNVIQATGGTVERFGRISTLLGLTAGFNPNFSGRENAYLFCSIQGLDRERTDARMSGIQSFADLGRYFDLPLRTYSSGMQARLAFACAIHVDSDLIIIDETLAVGDSNFRMRCYDRIREMKKSGQTFLLVSHNQNLVANFCTRGVVLEGGAKVFDGPTFQAVEAYKRVRTEAMGDDDLEGRVTKGAHGSAKLSNTAVLEDFQLSERVEDGEALVAISATLVAREQVGLIGVNFGVNNSVGIAVCALDGAKSGHAIDGMAPGETRRVEMTLHKKTLLPGRYFINAGVNELVGDVVRPLSLYLNFLFFDITGPETPTGVANLQMALAVGPRQEPAPAPEADVSHAS